MALHVVNSGPPTETVTAALLPPYLVISGSRFTLLSGPSGKPPSEENMSLTLYLNIEQLNYF